MAIIGLSEQVKIIVKSKTIPFCLNIITNSWFEPIYHSWRNLKSHPIKHFWNPRIYHKISSLSHVKSAPLHLDDIKANLARAPLNVYHEKTDKDKNQPPTIFLAVKSQAAAKHPNI